MIQVVQVTIDIKHGGDPNCVNPRSNGAIPVAILITDDFDATIVDPLSVQFGPDDAIWMGPRPASGSPTRLS